jgi:hypothetical protein
LDLSVPSSLVLERGRFPAGGFDPPAAGLSIERWTFCNSAFRSFWM